TETAQFALQGFIVGFGAKEFALEFRQVAFEGAQLGLNEIAIAAAGASEQQGQSQKQAATPTHRGTWPPLVKKPADWGTCWTAFVPAPDRPGHIPALPGRS